MSTHQTVPGLDTSTSVSVQGVLHQRLASLLDLHLTLKHVHWNIVGPNFIAVHEMLDEHVAGIRDMSDAVAERVRTLGGVPLGTPQAIVDRRTWDDYDIGRGTVEQHLRELDSVYAGVISDHRKAIAATGDDPITEDLLIGQTATLELYQWFVRSFIESVPSLPAGASAPIAAGQTTSG